MMKAVSSSNFFVKLLLKGSMQQLWGMIRAMQMIVLSAIIKVSYPAHTAMFFQGCMIFSKMDMFQGDDLFSNAFDFTHTEPFSDSFEYFGYETKNFLINSGSFTLFLVLIFLYTGFKWVLN